MKSSSQVKVSAAANGDSEATRFARYGLAIPRQILKALENRGIYCQSSVSIEHQHLAKRYVLRATESGGAVADMGRYCAYLDGNGGCSVISYTCLLMPLKKPHRSRTVSSILPKIILPLAVCSTLVTAISTDLPITLRA